MTELLKRAERIGLLDQRLGLVKTSYRDAVAMASRLYLADPDEAFAVLEEIEAQHESGATRIQLRRMDLLPGSLLEAES